MSDFGIGIAPAHAAALGCALVTPLLAVLGWRIVQARARLGFPLARRLRTGWAAADAPVRWAVWLLLLTGAVHLGLPLGHVDGAPLAVGFLTSGVGCGWLALRAILGRRWRGAAVALVTAMLVAYTVSVINGEEVDQVGLAAAVVELALLTLAIVPARPRRRSLANIGAVGLAVLFGSATWAVFVAGHGDGHHGGPFLARAQAGVVLRPDPPPATPDPQRAAALLAERTKAATVRYRDPAVARAAGFAATGRPEGLQVHFESKANQRDDRIVDPERPEMLVYAIEGGRALLLGVVFQMPVAGARGPAVGGTATRWHAHNLCFGLLPPGFGAVSPYGTCPFLTVSITTAEMMHVWVVDPPEGPYADGLNDAWVRTILRDGRRSA
jgi:hypothetical protein